MGDKFLKALHWIIDILNKNKIKYVISGGFSAYIYGSNRDLNDIDIDISENDFEKIYPEVKKYIISGPGKYKDEKWELERIDLKYFGQEIDIGGAFTQKIFDEVSLKWVHLPTNLNKFKIMNVDGIELKVMDPVELIEYKKLLNGDHQKIDIKATELFIKNNS
ncbi:MAG: hypothetical protein WCG91_03050 [Candidatus Shapirobacteria bacterium]